jgi:adenylylsulfate kinase-like enzyme
LEHCRSLDPTGLYADAEARSLEGIPGISFDYETPENPDLSLPSHQIDPGDSVNRILALMNERGFLR